MKLVKAKTTKGEDVLINPEAISYLTDYSSHCTVNFLGSREYLEVKESFRDLGLKIEGATR
jgi:hypothetical protein